MRVSDIKALIGYTFWADFEVLTAAERVSADDWVRQASPDPGWHTLRGTLVHMLDVYYGWRTSLQSLPDDGVIDPEAFADAASLKARWQVEMAAWDTYLATISDDALDVVWSTESKRQRRVWETVTHIYTEGVYHRAEVAAMLTGYGCSPGEIDLEGYLFWLAEKT